ncbi:MATE family efflux transporter [Methylophaga sulfidovorans]|uniref:Putative efflux protein, MATE family n=1 Tax=Methylophaga sulfidovorans TaxID=45496 RepID=A0A1I3USL0_9GAMM|nr:MATE family efflux transporter [Methylophaga sulfidovorans]SFJ84811.1 putative efflux protein, MATE family [Methylophaga sulfidovorans]
MDNAVLSGPIIPTFLRFAIPSILGLLAITTASIVDGIFVGQFVSAEGLAAINLLIPYLSLIFGLALMLSIGGAVRAGYYFGQKQFDAASDVFSQCLITIIVIGLSFMLLSWIFAENILFFLGTPDSILPLILPYFYIINAVLVVQISTMVMYYFIRQDNAQTLASSALISGAIINIVLDALFIIVFDWGLKGAAVATAIAQTIQLIMLGRYFLRTQKKLSFSLIQHHWSEIKPAMFNGGSEFINEISGGLVILVLNWLLVRRLDVEGIAAFAVINYLIFISLMLYYGISDALHLVVSQNHGAKNVQRIRQFLLTALSCILFISISLTLCLVFFPEQISRLFLDKTAENTLQLSKQFIALLWPLFLINGVNVIMSIYLTAIQKPIPSMVIALSRGLFLPILLLLILSWLLPEPKFLIALPLSEWLTFIIAIILFSIYRPSKQTQPSVI